MPPSSSAQNELICRFCLEPDVISNLISPCSCTGSSRYVHLRCLRIWQTSNSLDNPRRNAQDRRGEICQSCTSPFDPPPPSDMDMLVEKLKGCSVLKGLGMKQGTGEGRDSLKLSLIVGSHKMVGDAGRASGAARRAAPESSSFSQPVSASRWSSVRQRILEAVRGSSNSWTDMRKI